MKTVELHAKKNDKELLKSTKAIVEVKHKKEKQKHEEHANHYDIFLFIGLIILLTKIISSIFYKFKLPPVVGYILIGIVFGPAVLNLLKADNQIIAWLSHVGVILLLFEAGLDTSIRQMKEVGKSAFYTAIGGIVLPFIAGFGYSIYIFPGNIIKACFFGTILVATSVGVTVMSLMDLKKLKTSEGSIIISAAIIDDFIGIIILTVIGSLANSEKNIGFEILKIFIFLALLVTLGRYIIRIIMGIAHYIKVDSSLSSIGIALAFIASWSAETMNVAAITGAYLCGLFIGEISEKTKMEVVSDVQKIGQILFVSMFFVHIGLETKFNFGINQIGFILILSFLAILTKMVGSGFGAKLGGYDKISSMIIGTGMSPRGEVALIVAGLGVKVKMLDQVDFSSIVVMVFITAVSTPIILKYLYGLKSKRIRA